VALNDLLAALLIDTHDDLVRAWRAMIRAGKVEAMSKDLTAIPISEQEILRLGKEKWDDPVFRNEKIAEWTEFARSKYKRIVRSLRTQ